jgi:p21-activated kinase 1
MDLERAAFIEQVLQHIVSPDLPSYLDMELLGEGGFGKVYRAVREYDNKEVAVKMIKIPEQLTPFQQQSILNELIFLKAFCHKNIIGYEDSYLLEDQLFIEMEYMDGSNLLNAIDSWEQTENEIAYVAKETLQALAFLHSNHVIHRDVKSENILMNNTGKIKLADLGLAVYNEAPMTSIAGTTLYWAPEIVYNTGYNEKVDIWALGITTYHMVFKQLPFCIIDDIPQPIAFIGSPDFPKEDLSPALADFLDQCLESDPGKRLSAQELLPHPFLINPDATES